MITVETRPIRLSAVQWHQAGDCPELVTSYRHGDEIRYGVHGALGMQRVTPGCWIVIGNGAARVLSPAEFEQKFRVVAEEENNQ